MNPLKRISFNAPVILSFAILSAAVLAISRLTNGISDRLFFSVYGHSWTNPLGYVRLFGHILGHADLQHYSSNFLLILLIGPMLEERYGSKNLLIMIALTALATGVFSALFIPNMAVFGASGVAFMMILLSSFVSSQKGTIPVTLILAVVIYVGRELVGGVSNLVGMTSDDISQLAHVIGGICGIAFGILYKKQRVY